MLLLVFLWRGIYGCCLGGPLCSIIQVQIPVELRYVVLLWGLTTPHKNLAVVHLNSNTYRRLGTLNVQQANIPSKHYVHELLWDLEAEYPSQLMFVIIFVGNLLE